MRPPLAPYQWFLLGMLVAWTPGLVVLALMLRRAHLPEQRGAHQLDSQPRNSNQLRNEHNRLIGQKGRPGRGDYQPYNQNNRRPKTVKY